MTLQECTAILTPLALALRAEIDYPTFKAYHRVLQKASPALLEAARDALLHDAGLRFFPTAPELLKATEAARRQFLAAYPHEGCEDCEHQRGWRTVISDAGQPVVQRCPCVARHRDKLQRLGLAEPLAELSGGVEHEADFNYPTLEQLPYDVRQKLVGVTARKVLV